MPSLFYDGDKRRIYAVPDNSSFVVDGNGYRVYTPNDIPSAPTEVIYRELELWKGFVDYHNINKWTTLAFARSGGTFRQTTSQGDVYAPTDLRYINDWAFVPANYDHTIVISGNVYPNASTGLLYDFTRLTANVTLSREFAESGQVLVQDGASAGQDWTAEERRQMRDALGIDGTKAPAVGGQLQTTKNNAIIAASNTQPS